MAIKSAMRVMSVAVTHLDNTERTDECGVLLLAIDHNTFASENRVQFHRCLLIVEQGQSFSIVVQDSNCCLSAVRLNLRSFGVQVNKRNRVGFVFVAHRVGDFFRCGWSVRVELQKTDAQSLLESTGCGLRNRKIHWDKDWPIDLPRFFQPVITEDFKTAANSLGVR
jgi:hypothetical protein